jgi:hypothetical protein
MTEKRNYKDKNYTVVGTLKFKIPKIENFDVKEGDWIEGIFYKSDETKETFAREIVDFNSKFQPGVASGTCSVSKIEVKIDYWSTDENAEHLHHETIDEAMAEYLEGFGPDFGDAEEEVELTGYTRKTISEEIRDSYADTLVETLSELLNEEFDGEDGHEVPADAKNLARVFVNGYLENYQPWVCTPVVTKTVNLKEWLEQQKKEGINV